MSEDDIKTVASPVADEGMSTGKKVGIGLGICCMGLIIILVIVAMVSPDANTNKSSSNGSDSPKGWQVVITTNASWSGSINADGTGSTYEGKGDKTINITDNPLTVAAVIQKKGGNNKELKVQILKDGEVKKESSTTAQYGVVEVAS